MTRIVWDQKSDLEYGIDRGVLYLSDDLVLAWNGLTSVKETIDGESKSSYYFDGVKTLDVIRNEEFQLNVSALFCPEEFEDYEGMFGFCYRITRGISHRLHLVYNITASHSGDTWTTKSEALNQSDFEWNFNTVPVEVPYLKPTAHLIVDFLDASIDAIEELTTILYGDDSNDARLPSIEEVISIFEGYATLVVVDNGDGTWTATGPDSAFEFPTETSFAITWPSVHYVDDVTFTISSL